MPMMRSLKELFANRDLSMAFHPAPGRDHRVRVPREISVEDWMALDQAKRAPVRGLALMQLSDADFLCAIVDTEAQQPMWLIRGDAALLHRFVRIVTQSGGDGRTGVVISDGPFVCPPWCPTEGINRPDPKDPPPPPGDGELGLLARARLIERALTAAHVKIDVDGESMLGLATR